MEPCDAPSAALPPILQRRWTPVAVGKLALCFAGPGIALWDRRYLALPVVSAASSQSEATHQSMCPAAIVHQQRPGKSVVSPLCQLPQNCPYSADFRNTRYWRDAPLMLSKTHSAKLGRISQRASPGIAFRRSGVRTPSAPPKPRPGRGVSIASEFSHMCEGESVRTVCEMERSFLDPSPLGAAVPGP